MSFAQSTVTPHNATTVRAAAPAALSPQQIRRLVAWAVLLWFSAALCIRYAPAAAFARGPVTMLLFAAALPLGWLAVRGTRRVAALRPDQLVAGAALTSATAMLCDGIALTWSSLYGSDPASLLPAAAWLLWGVAVILLMAFVAARRAGV